MEVVVVSCSQGDSENSLTSDESDTIKRKNANNSLIQASSETVKICGFFFNVVN